MSLEANTAVDLQEVVIVGNSRTKVSFFAEELKQTVFAPHVRGTGATVQSYYESLNTFTAKLLEANMFDHVDSNLRVDSIEEGRCKASLVVTVKEKGVPFVNANSYMRAGDKSDVGFEVKAALRSPLGHGEHLGISSATSAAGTREYSGFIRIPHFSGAWDISARSGSDQPLPWLSYQVATKSLLVQYKPSSDSKHQLVAEYALRDETPNSAKPVSNALLDMVSSVVPVTTVPGSAAVLASATASVKSSVKHVWTIADEQRLADAGSSKFLQTSVELAAALGAPGAADFIKTDVTARYERQIGPRVFAQPGLTLSLGGSLGVMYPLGLVAPALSGKADGLRPFASNLCDRYHLGGPLSLRGFGPSGVGPRGADQKDSLGGDTKAAAVAMLSVPVPVPALAAASMRAFIFANCGGLGSSDYWVQQSSKQGLAKLTPSFGSLRASLGAGLSMHAGGAVRVEGTYSFPFLKAPHDSTTAFQLGVGLSIN